jgi:tRNA threonylcarbamoyladenosine biosynthesis protein TsaE
MKNIICENQEKTKALGHRLGALLQDGDVLCLTGDLGAGKTFLTTAMAESLGVEAKDVTSPTFSLLNIYHGRKLVLKHFDLYRLNREEELDDIGFYEYAGGDGITFIEWAELFPQALPEEHLTIRIENQGEGREVTLEPHGKRYEEICERV